MDALGVAATNAPGRTLHLVDIENLAGAPATWMDERIVMLISQYLQEASWSPGDSLVVASNPDLMRSLAFKLAESGIAHRALCGYGTDRADNLLLSAVPNDVSGRFGRVVVGSGDRAFLPLVSRLKGTTTTLVVLGAGQPYWKLSRAANDVCQLPGTHGGRVARARRTQGARHLRNESARRLGMDLESHRPVLASTVERKAVRGSEGGNVALEGDPGSSPVGGKP